MFNYFRMKKRGGLAILIVCVVTAGIIGGIAFSLTQIHNTNFNILKKNNRVYQAQLYAMDEANLMRAIGYDATSAKPMEEINGSGLYRKIDVTYGVIADGSVNYKDVKVSVYGSNDVNIKPLIIYTLKVYQSK